MTGEIYGYLYQGTLTKKPKNTHLDIELDSGNKIIVDSADDTKVYHVNVSTRVETQVDVDPSNTSGDGKSRDHPIQAAYHDRANQTIWFVDCENPGDDFDAWKLDYSASETAPTVTEVGTSSDADAGTEYALDIFYYDSKAYVIYGHDETGTGEFGVYDITSAPFTKKDNDTGWGVPDFKFGYGVLYSIKFRIYFAPDDVGNWRYMEYNTTTEVFTVGSFTAATNNEEMPDSYNLRGIAYDGVDNIYFIAEDIDNGDALTLYKNSITGGTLTKLGEMNIALMLDRNTDTSLSPECFTLEKAFGVTAGTNGLYAYQIPRTYSGKLNWIASLQATYDAQSYSNAYIASITDTYLIVDATDDGGNIDLWKFADMMTYVSKPEITHDKEDYASCKLQHRRVFTCNTMEHVWDFQKNMFLQIFGTYSVDGSATTDQVIFEGVVDDYDGLRLELVYLENQAREIDNIEPSGDYSGRTDQIITGVRDDEADYITEGTLSAGHAMGTLTYSGSKTYYRILSNMKDQDEFTWYFKPTGILDYNNGATDSGADLLRDASNKDAIWNVTPSHPVRGVNKVVVNGAINEATGAPYTGSAENEVDQQVNGIVKIVINDASLNSNALCADKATNILSRDSANPTVIRFAYRKTTIGFIQPGQTITFKYDTTKVSISQAQYIVDRIVYDAKTGVGFIEVSSGLIFQYDPASDNLPEENSQLIGQLSAKVVDEADHSVHDNVASEITAIAEKATLAANDEFLIEDSADSNNKKSAKISAIRITESQISDLGSYSRVATGTYTGNAASNRQITGLGFDPTCVMIFEVRDPCRSCIVTDSMAAWTDIYEDDNSFLLAANQNGVKLITDGFEVNNNHASDLMNANAQVYHWVAWG